MMDDSASKYQKCREAAGLRQAYAASLLGVSERTLSGYENGCNVPDDIVVRIGEIYQTRLLIWWHMGYKTPYGSILPDILEEPQTIGDMMFMLDLAVEKSEEGYKNFREILKDHKMTPEEIPLAKEAIKCVRETAAQLLLTASFGNDLIDKTEKEAQRIN